MKLSYSAVWDDTVALLRAHGSLIAALAGAFLFLPALLLATLAPQPTGMQPPDIMPALTAWFRENLLWLVLARLVELVGSIAILRLVFGPRGTSVAAAIGAGGTLLIFYLIPFILANLAVAFGFLLLIVPGLYLMGRFAPLGPVVVAEERRNPADALARTWALTAGRGWAVTGLILLVAIAGGITMLVVNGVFGIVFLLVLGKGLGGFLGRLVGAATGTAFSVLLLLLYASIYRALVARGSAEVFH